MMPVMHIRTTSQEASDYLRQAGVKIVKRADASEIVFEIDPNRKPDIINHLGYYHAGHYTMQPKPKRTYTKSDQLGKKKSPVPLVKTSINLRADTLEQVKAFISTSTSGVKNVSEAIDLLLRSVLPFTSADEEAAIVRIAGDLTEN